MRLYTLPEDPQIPNPDEPRPPDEPTQPPIGDPSDPQPITDPVPPGAPG